jgi:hypothetical protein
MIVVILTARKSRCPHLLLNTILAILLILSISKAFIGTTEHEDGRLEFWPALSAGSPFTSNPSAPTYYGTPGVCTGTEYGDPAPIFPFQDPGAWIEPSSQWRLQDDGSIVRGGPGEVDTLSTCPHASFNSSVFRPGIGGPAPPQLSSPSEVALRMRGNNGASPVDTRSFAPSQGRPIYPTGFLLEGNDGRFQELPLNEFEERVPSEELSEVRTQDAEGPSRLSTHVHDELVNLIKRRGTEITFEYVKDPKTGIAGWQPVQRGWVDESQ